ncbi:MAG: O-methyltransferase [Actinomycetota bacterium]|nr:O-methyltransferase [Actinomycetota bacterium]
MTDVHPTSELWTAVDGYICDQLVASDLVLDAALADSAAAGLPSIAVSPTQGRLLALLAQMCSARTILEVGTLGGYSTIWLARALGPGGRLITLEVDPRHADVARANLARAGLSDVVDVRLGAALDTLPRLVSDGLGPVDLTFIDADKPNNPDYFQWALRLSRPGSVIVIDNVVRGGAVVDADSTDPATRGTRRLYDALAGEPRVDATVIQTVGSKGYDGFAIAVVTG